jgi:hypothetical protein
LSSKASKCTNMATLAAFDGITVLCPNIRPRATVSSSSTNQVSNSSTVSALQSGSSDLLSIYRPLLPTLQAFPSVALCSARAFGRRERLATGCSNRVEGRRVVRRRGEGAIRAWGALLVPTLSGSEARSNSLSRCASCGAAGSDNLLACIREEAKRYRVKLREPMHRIRAPFTARPTSLRPSRHPPLQTTYHPLHHSSPSYPHLPYSFPSSTWLPSASSRREAPPKRSRWRRFRRSASECWCWRSPKLQHRSTSMRSSPCWSSDPTAIHRERSARLVALEVPTSSSWKLCEWTSRWGRRQE